MGQNRQTSGFGYHPHSFFCGIPEFILIGRGSLGKVKIKSLVNRGCLTLFHHNPGKMGPADLIAAGFRQNFFQGNIEAQFIELGNNLWISLPPGFLESSKFRQQIRFRVINVITEHMHGSPGNRDADLDARDHFKAKFAAPG